MNLIDQLTDEECEEYNLHAEKLLEYIQNRNSRTGQTSVSAVRRIPCSGRAIRVKIVNGELVIFEIWPSLTLR